MPAFHHICFKTYLASKITENFSVILSNFLPFLLSPEASAILVIVLTFHNHIFVFVHIYKEHTA